MFINEDSIYYTNLFKVTFGIMATVVLSSVYYYPLLEAGFSDIDAKLISLVLSIPISLSIVKYKWIVHRLKRSSIKKKDLNKKEISKIR